MITGDIGARLREILRAEAAAGRLPAESASVSPSGTWRPAPVEAGGGPGTYATSLPFTLATPAGRQPLALAAQLASRLAAVPWVSRARPTGSGYLTVTVAVSRLAGLPARIIAAGPDAARSDALGGVVATVPRTPGPCATWEEAWRSHRDAILGRLAHAAGATVNFLPVEQFSAPVPDHPASRGPVTAAVAWHGADAVRYALARTAFPAVRAIERQLIVPLHAQNPFVAVRYAHADAASTLRWAADLGLTGEHGRAAAFGRAAAYRAPDPLPPELRLLDLLSWLPERVGAAARRRRAAELTDYLEAVAAAWLGCQESCPALPFRGAAAAGAVTAPATALAEPAAPAPTRAGTAPAPIRAGTAPASVRAETVPPPAAPPPAAAAPVAPDVAVLAARLALADATRIVLAAGLSLLGIEAPARL